MPDSPSYTGPEDPFQQFNFKVEIDGVKVGGFNQASGLNLQMDTVEYREGGVNGYVHQLPGQFAHSNLVLQKGLTMRDVLWNWIRDVRNGVMEKKNARKMVHLKLQDEYKSDEMWGWEFKNAYPVKWEGPTLTGEDAGGQNTVAVETIELAHQGFCKLSGTPR